MLPHNSRIITQRLEIGRLGNIWAAHRPREHRGWHCQRTDFHVGSTAAAATAVAAVAAGIAAATQTTARGPSFAAAAFGADVQQLVGLILGLPECETCLCLHWSLLSSDFLRAPMVSGVRC